MIFLVIFSLLHFALLYIMVNIKYEYSICGHPVNINKLMTLQERLRINSILHCFVILFACMYFFLNGIISLFVMHRQFYKSPNSKLSMQDTRRYKIPARSIIRHYVKEKKMAPFQRPQVIRKYVSRAIVTTIVGVCESKIRLLIILEFVNVNIAS